MGQKRPQDKPGHRQSEGLALSLDGARDLWRGQKILAVQVGDMRPGSKPFFSVSFGLLISKSGAHTLSSERPSSLESPISSLLAGFPWL